MQSGCKMQFSYLKSFFINKTKTNTSFTEEIRKGYTTGLIRKLERERERERERG
jgi:hypothetical protein